MRDKDTLDVVWDNTLRIQVDDVSDGKGTEFRSSIYAGSDYELMADGWGNTISEAIQESIITLMSYGGK